MHTRARFTFFCLPDYTFLCTFSIGDSTLQPLSKILIKVKALKGLFGVSGVLRSRVGHSPDARVNFVLPVGRRIASWM